jgi:subtilisin family serine protease
MKNLSRAILVLSSLWATGLMAAQGGPPATQTTVEKARQAASEGKLAYKLTTADELKELLGPPASEKTSQDGGMELLDLQYPDLTVRFTRMAGFEAPFTLVTLSGRTNWLGGIIGPGGGIDIGQDRQVELRTEADLAKFDAFWGFAGVSLARLDLRNHEAVLRKMEFDSRTRWPSADRLPAGFDPNRLLEEGKNPGLGVRRLHEQGIDGRGVGIAIIDQPLLRNHKEYADRIVHYEPIEVPWVPVQMHGPPVSSIAVGKDCGVAPKASLYYYAVPPWKWQDNKPWADLLERIVEFNETLGDKPRIRVVSISLGMFSVRPNFDAWTKAVEKASQHGILVVTCDSAFLRLATLRRDPSGDFDDPNCYRTARYSDKRPALCVPAGNRTTASHHGPDVYTYEIEGGMSWAVPYLAGVAALACQIDPEITPAQIVQLWTATATKTEAGPIVSPPGFIETVRAERDKRRP